MYFIQNVIYTLHGELPLLAMRSLSDNGGLSKQNITQQLVLPVSQLSSPYRMRRPSKLPSQYK
jgi:hypothetical protein